jgi:hypothetical protein
VWVADVEFFIFVAAFSVFAAALIAMVVHPLTWARWLNACGAGIFWLAVWYAPLWF